MFSITGTTGVSALFKPLTEMMLVACIEELVFRECWAATAAAAASLEVELDHPLSATIEQAIDALTATPFGERLRAARANLRG